MDRSRAALATVIVAQWLAIIGGVLIIWGLLLGGSLGHLAAGGIGLALAVAAGGFALSLAGMPVKPTWDMRLSQE